jgi:ectoine hydroxylase-related dioxygenase (phytanoyl-CoA dioxygenase family)
MVADNKAVACPMKAGGATFHCMRTLHVSAANTTATPRRAFILKFANPGAAAAVDDPPERPWQTVSNGVGAKKRRAAAKQGILIGAARAVLGKAGAQPKL